MTDDEWRRLIVASLSGGGPRRVFQPIVELEGGALVGYEALSRFDSGSPDEWFVAATRVGLDYELEMRAMLGALGDLPAVPAGAYLAVNISPATLVHPRFASDLRDVDLSRVVFELTEHAAVTDYTLLRSALGPLRRAGGIICTPVGPASTVSRLSVVPSVTVAGARLSVDDFGAGFASTRHVIALAPDFMKLDRSLVSGVDSSRVQRAVIAGLVTFGAKMGVQVVAEGIETETEAATLRALDVHSGQGWLFGAGAPLPSLL